jgi:WD40 repeat protein
MKKPGVPVPTFVFRSLTSGISSLVTNQEAGTQQGILWSGDYSGGLMTFGLERKRMVGSKEKAHSSVVQGLQYFDEEKQLLSQGRDGKIKIWACENTGLSQDPISELSCGTLSFCKAVAGNLHHISNSKIVSTTSEDGHVIKLWDINNKTEILSLNAENPSDRKYGMCMATYMINSESESYLGACYEDGGLYFWNLKKPDTFAFGAKLISNEPMLCFTINQQQDKGICGGASPTIATFSLSLSLNQLNILQTITLPNPGIQQIEIRKDHKIFATAGWDHRIRVYSWKNCKPLSIIKYHEESVHTILFSQVDNLLISGSKDARIALWNLY